jgi:hypothetical protein
MSNSFQDPGIIHDLKAFAMFVELMNIQFPIGGLDHYYPKTWK